VSPLVISLIAFGCIFGSMLLGMFLRQVLPDHHLSDESKDVMKLGTAMIATLAALVIGLLIASAKSSFDTLNNGLVQAGSKVMLLDRTLANYGSETREARDLLRRVIASNIERIWPKERKGQREFATPDPRAGIEAIEDKIRQLSPQNDASAGFTRGLAAEQRHGGHALAALHKTWAELISNGIFGDTGLMARDYLLQLRLVLASQCDGFYRLVRLCVVVAGSLYLIQELDRPYGG